MTNYNQKKEEDKKMRVKELIDKRRARENSGATQGPFGATQGPKY